MDKLSFGENVSAISKALEKLQTDNNQLRNFVEGLVHLHASNPSDALADLSPLDYHKYIMGEVRQRARELLNEIYTEAD